MTATRPVAFTSGGLTCRGRLHRPAGDAPAPCVVMAHGFSGTMDALLPSYAERFVAGGLAVLLFDYRHFGESDGSPRQLVDAARQRADLRRAVELAREQPEVDGDAVALWGSSLGGSHVVELAADDPSIAAVVANVPALDVWRGRGDLRREMAQRGLGWGEVARATARLVAAAVVDEARGLLHRSPHYIAVFGPMDRAVFSDPGLAGWFHDLETTSPTWENRVTPRFLLHAPRYRAGTMERLGMPLLVTLARDDTEISWRFVADRAARAPRAEVKLLPVGHFDVYHGRTFDEVAAEHLAFLRRHLIEDRRAPERLAASPR
ncbi:alpha/beta hydrolase [Actinomycetospora lemnae]|uniref:Alpha/beta fold hydrolase n=1 Tax=Actinomycetospora lemnae TaxID=3019891 RepID=A0ABT5SZ32_9PSEU|nr:alpha/beta fold hydrolase [Actinomycetospora sp. DW7H6]MDD7967971.1 alpha/beta fold hydrolase [Actinomycetospora sp. DW7H6]